MPAQQKALAIGGTPTDNAVTKKVVIYSYKDTTKKSTLTYSFPQKNTLLLTGILNNNTVRIEMNKYDINNFMLVSRGFHWVNEYPLNR